MKSTTAGQHSFAQIPSAEIQRSQFDRSCGLKTTFDAGWLVPIFCDEALPGDSINLSMSSFARLATPLHPIMDNMFIDTFFFAVPNRLLWENWQRFNGEQDNPGDSTDFTIPEVVAGTLGYGNSSIFDYMGLPTGIGNYASSALWLRAFNLIFNEWFRDENLQDSVPYNMGNGPDTLTDYTMLRRGKRHDYATSCLPWPQKGPDVFLPLGTSAPVVPVTPGTSLPLFDVGGNVSSIGSDGTSSESVTWVTQDPGANDVAGTWATTGLEADLQSATAATINQLREAFQIQRLYERDARGGSRYTEILRSHFGVTSPDSRLQRPEYLGGGTQMVNMQSVPQTSQTDTTPQGTLAAYGTSSSNGIGFKKSFTEHCIIIGLVSLRADLNYQQGLDRQFSRSTRWDFFWPALSHLGEQEVLNKELMIQDDPDDELVFGYQERYAEYRYKPSKITGQFRSNFAQTLDTWHLAQDFATLPVLGDTFIQENPPIDRVIAVPSEPHLIYDAYFKFKHARPMPTYGVPGMIDHF